MYLVVVVVVLVVVVCEFILFGFTFTGKNLDLNFKGILIFRFGSSPSNFILPLLPHAGTQTTTGIGCQTVSPRVFPLVSFVLS